jgi:hypothetical protein
MWVATEYCRKHKWNDHSHPPQIWQIDVPNKIFVKGRTVGQYEPGHQKSNGYKDNCEDKLKFESSGGGEFDL